LQLKLQSLGIATAFDVQDVDATFLQQVACAEAVTGQGRESAVPGAVILADPEACFTVLVRQYPVASGAKRQLQYRLAKTEVHGARPVAHGHERSRARCLDQPEEEREVLEALRRPQVRGRPEHRRQGERTQVDN